MSTARPALYVVAVNPDDLTTSFTRVHIERLPADAVAIHGYVPAIGSTPVLPAGLVSRGWRKLSRLARGQEWSEEITQAYVRAFARRPAAVLAEFGPTAVRLVEPCRRAGLPLVAHFHGYDASVKSVLAEHQEGYRRVFEYASAIIAVSRAMCNGLRGLGAPAEKLHYCPYGVDCHLFHPADASKTPPVVLAVGRLVEKKAPHLTILAFAEVHRRRPDARLRMIGDGPLIGVCRDLVTSLGLTDAVTMLGSRPHEEIMREMRQARCFAQHSVQALDGDCEGTPNTILEAGASGLPVVSTRHAGIPDVVVEHHTGFLVDERDVSSMAQHLEQLLADPQLAGDMGRNARAHIERHFTMEQRLAALWAVIAATIDGRPAPPPSLAAGTLTAAREA